MKKILITGFLVFMALCFSCEEESNSSGGIFSTGEISTEPATWNLLLNPILGLEKYYVKVEISGGSGTAVVSARLVSGGNETLLGNFTVYDGLDIWLSDLGPVIKFSNAGGFNLVAPDEWVIMIDSGQLVGIFPTGLNTSTAMLSLVSPREIPYCKYGLFNSFPNLTISMGGSTQKMSVLGMQVQTSDYGVTGDIPETSLLLFSTAYPLVPGSSQVVKNGDSVTISYTRKVVSDGQGGDYFAMMVLNNRTAQPLDGVTGGSAGKTRVSRTFTANGNFFGVQLLFGLSGKGDSVMIDDFQVRINNKLVFSDDFEAGALKNAFPNYLWQIAQPATMRGSIGICSQKALSGNKSFCVKGGRSFILYGQGMTSGGITGMEFTLSDGSIGSSYFVGSFMGATSTSDSVMFGTYSGRNYDETCTEDGGFVNLINSSHTSDVQGTWDITINAKLKHCDNPADKGELKLKMNNVKLDQINSLFGGLLQAPDQNDSLGNTISSFGLINGESLMLYLSTKVPAVRFYRLSLSGTAGNNPIKGQVMGWTSANPMMLFQTCDVEGTFTLSR